MSWAPLTTETTVSSILLLDVMSTLVVEPFFELLPRFFNMSLNELLEAKHPTAWVDFEKGLLDEEGFYANFFAGGRRIDGPGLRDTMTEG